MIKVLKVFFIFFISTQLGAMNCPLVDQLTRDSHLYWQAPNGWKSTESSFATEISHWVGIQWRGINLGTVYCIYEATDRKLFKVVLQYNQLVFEPRQGNWKNNLGGYKICQGEKSKDCPFLVKINSKKVNLFQGISEWQAAPAKELGF